MAAETQSVGSADILLSALGGLTEGMTDADEIASAVDAWFDASVGDGGYLDTIYGGSEAAVSGLKVSDNTEISLSVTASDTSIRDVLKGLALAALASDSVSYSDDLKLDLATRAAQKLLSADTGLVETQARLGVAELAVETAGTRNSAEKTSLNTARTSLIGADSYESATALQAVQTQLETLYTLTSQLSDMSLVNYL